MGSTEHIPKHALRPTSEDSWCKYPISQLNKEEYKNEEHTQLPTNIIEELKTIFGDLSNAVLLSKRKHGGSPSLFRQNFSQFLGKFCLLLKLHNANLATRFLDAHIPNQWIDTQGLIAWPSRSPNLPPLNCFRLVL